MESAFKPSVLWRACRLIMSGSLLFAGVMFCVLYFALPFGFIGNVIVYWGTAFLFYALRTLVAAALLANRWSKKPALAANFEQLSLEEKAAMIAGVDEGGLPSDD